MGNGFFFDNCKEKFKNTSFRSPNATIMDHETISAKALLEHIEKILEKENYIDSVHKIKLMTTRDMIKKMLQNDF